MAEVSTIEWKRKSAFRKRARSKSDCKLRKAYRLRCTPDYVAPERLTSEPEDFRSGIYSLGATLFHAVAGRPPFEHETQSAAELKKLKANPIGLQAVAHHASEETAIVTDRMLRPNPKERQTSYQELIDQLQLAHTNAVARGSLARTLELAGTILASLGGLLLVAAPAIGVVFGWQSTRRLSDLHEMGKIAVAYA